MLNLIYTAGYAAIVSCISNSIITDGTVTTGLGSTIMMNNFASNLFAVMSIFGNSLIIL
jgi:hypothetical protein